MNNKIIKNLLYFFLIFSIAHKSFALTSSENIALTYVQKSQNKNVEYKDDKLLLWVDVHHFDKVVAGSLCSLGALLCVSPLYLQKYFKGYERQVSEPLLSDQVRYRGGRVEHVISASVNIHESNKRLAYIIASESFGIFLLAGGLLAVYKLCNLSKIPYWTFDENGLSILGECVLNWNDVSKIVVEDKDSNNDVLFDSSSVPGKKTEKRALFVGEESVLYEVVSNDLLLPIPFDDFVFLAQTYLQATQGHMDEK